MLFDLWSLGQDAVFSQLSKYLFCRFTVPECGAQANIEPGRVSRKPGFAKGY